MDHIRLSPRLQMVADFVPPCACAADIGTDHGYLPIWLLQNGVIRSAIAADIHAGPLANARQSAAAYDLEERFRFVLADGLRFPDAQAADVVTIAGMGGETICAILAAAPWLRQGKQLVLQPQSKVPELTDWLWRNGFTIEDAALCRDAGKRYLALRVLGQTAAQAYTLEQLLFMLIVRSANDAAAVIAEHIAGSQSTFIDMMNTEAVELGCENTHFTNPHGLPDEEQYTTARDIAIIMEAALAYPLFGELYAATTYQAPSTELQAARTFYTSNFLITEDITPGYLDSRVIGGFVGTTSAAGRCAACVAEYDSLRYLVVILGSSSQSDENGNPVYTNLRSTSALLDYACTTFMPQRVLSADTSLTPIPVNYGDRDVVPITAGGITALLPTDYDEGLLRTEVTLPDGRLVAPITAGSEIGSADMYYGSFLLGTVPLTASNEVSLVDASEDENAAEESATGRALRITVTVVAGIIGGTALILLLLMIRASIIRTLRKRRIQRERAIRNAKRHRRQ